MTNASNSLAARAGARWSQLKPQEQLGIQLATILVVAFILWIASVGPNLQQWRTANAKGLALDAQLQQMQTLQAQAQAIQVQPALTYDDAVLALKQATVQSLASTAQLSISGDRATATVQNAEPQALAQWLTQARVNARCVPLEAKLTRAHASGPTLWNGTLTLSLPSR